MRGQRGVEVPLRGLELCGERVVLLLRGACAAACRQQEGGSECGEDEERGRRGSMDRGECGHSLVGEARVLSNTTIPKKAASASRRGRVSGVVVFAATSTRSRSVGMMPP